MNDGNWTGQWPWPSNSSNWVFFNGVGFEYKQMGSHDPYKGCRVGEAGNPGPFQVSCLNIQSLNAAVNDAKLTMPTCGLLALTETSATQVGIDKACKMAAAQRCHSFHSRPSKYRNYTRGLRSEARGEATGTWVASSQHVRHLDAPWPEDIWNLARARDSIVYTDMGPIYVACLYGLHQCLPDSYATTDRILECVFRRAEQVQMPAIICGDLNAPLSELTTWESMQARSWVDAAVLQASRDGIPPRNTYKESTRIDYILMNRYATRAFQSFSVSELPVTDHRQLFAEFSWEKITGLETVWKMPADLRHSKVTGDALQAASVPATMLHNFSQSLETDDMDLAFAQWTTAFEYVANRVSLTTLNERLPPTFRGKGRCKFVQRMAAKPYLKKGRDDTLQLDPQDLGVTFRQRVKQVRRLDAYLAQLRHPHPLPAGRCAEAKRVWQAITTAPGFPKNFPCWCLHELDTCCPLDPPPEYWLRQLLSQQVPMWRAKARAKQIKETRKTFDDDWTNGGRLSFQALKPATHPPVDAIDRVDQLRVKSYRTRKKGCATFRLPDEDWHMVSIGQVWKQGNAKGFVTSKDGDVICVRVTSGTMRTGYVSAFTTCHDPLQALHLATSYWSGFWNHQHETDMLDADVSDMCNSLPSLPTTDAAISMYELQSALKTLPIAKARGMDGITNWELRHMCLDLCAMLLSLLNRVTTTGRWPSLLIKARMHLIRKTDEAGDITSTCPICILPNVFRLWGKIMTSKCFKSIMPLIPPCLVGSIPGRRSNDLAMQLQISLEDHILRNKQMYGAALDLPKAFNTLDRKLLAVLCERLGLKKIWEPYMSALSQMQRFFIITGTWSTPVHSITGVPEGCPLSVVMMAIVTWAITNSLADKYPGKTLFSYVDDWTLRDHDPKDLLTQVWFIKRLTDKLGLKLSMSKTVMYATTGPARKLLKKSLIQENLNIDVSDSGVGLGIEYQSRGRRVTNVRNFRLEKVTPLLNKLRVMPWTSLKRPKS